MEIPIYSNIREDLELIETFLWDPEKGAPDIDLHLERMCKSATNLKFKFEIIKIKEKILEIYSQSCLRCRLTLRFDGEISLTTAPLSPNSKLIPVRLKADVIRRVFESRIWKEKLFPVIQESLNRSNIQIMYKIRNSL